MITRLQLVNWRSFRHASLKLGATNILLGDNGTGKTAVLDALRAVGNIWRGQAIPDAFGAHRHACESQPAGITIKGKPPVPWRYSVCCPGPNGSGYNEVITAGSAMTTTIRTDTTLPEQMHETLLRIDPKQLVERAVRTTDTHRYAEVLIQASDNRTTIRTRTNGLETNEYHSTSNAIERDLHGLGITRYLGCHNISAREVVRDARKAMTQSTQRTIAHIARPDDPARGVFGTEHPPAPPPPATGFADGQDRNKDPSRGR